MKSLKNRQRSSITLFQRKIGSNE